MKVTNTNLNLAQLRSTMESGIGANAVVPFFAHLTLYHLKFSTVWQSTNTQKILVVSMLSPGAFNSIVKILKMV